MDNSDDNSEITNHQTSHLRSSRSRDSLVPRSPISPETVSTVHPELVPKAPTAQNSDDEVDWNHEIDNFKLSDSPLPSSRGTDSRLPPPPVHPIPETPSPKRLRLEPLLHNSPAQTSGADLVPVGLSDERFASLVEMGFPGYLIYRAIKEAGPKAELSDIIDIISKYPDNDEAGCSRSKTVNHFLAMGFDEGKIIKAINEHGDDNMEDIANALISCESTENEDLLIIDSTSSDDEKEPNRMQALVSMGFSEEDAAFAVLRCGEKASFTELTDMIYAAETAREFDDSEQQQQQQQQQQPRQVIKKRRFQPWSRGVQRSPSDYEPDRLPNPMVGFGLPNENRVIRETPLSSRAQVPPFFYFENVALAPNGVWKTISQDLYDIPPEFMDSKHICAVERKRGYIHNLPITNRFQVQPLPKPTIQEALPYTKEWWPSWDARTKVNCIPTGAASGTVLNDLFTTLESYNGKPPSEVQVEVLKKCREWDLVWVGKDRLATLEPTEKEKLLGFPTNHTRCCGISRTEQNKVLSNSYQVDTVAYHLSVLHPLFPNGINVLSLFSGIGGAEVALHRLGIRMKTVVSVEISEVNRRILRSFWKGTKQGGELIEIAEVKALTKEKIEELMDKYGEFDLVIGASPYTTNLAGSNRVSRAGLQGAQSLLRRKHFFEYCRILDVVRQKTGRMRRNRG